MAHRNEHTMILANLWALIASASMVGGAASTALSQDYLLRLESSSQSVDPSTDTSTVVIDVIGDMFRPSEHEYMLWGSFALETFGAGVADIAWEHAAWSDFNYDSGYSNNGNYGMVEFGQWEFGDGWTPNAGSEIGNRIGSFTITFDEGVTTGEALNVRLVHAGRYALSTIDIDSGQSYYSTPESLLLGDATIQIVPAPAGMMCLLGLGAWGSARRRSRIQAG